MKDASLNAYPFHSTVARNAENRILADLSAGIAESALGVTGTDRENREAARIAAATERNTDHVRNAQEWASGAERHGYKIGWMDSQLAAIRAVTILCTDGLLSVENAALVLNAALGIKCPAYKPVGTRNGGVS